MKSEIKPFNMLHYIKEVKTQIMSNCIEKPSRKTLLITGQLLEYQPLHEQQNKVEESFD